MPLVPSQSSSQSFPVVYTLERRRLPFATGPAPAKRGIGCKRVDGACETELEPPARPPDVVVDLETMLLLEG